MLDTVSWRLQTLLLGFMIRRNQQVKTSSCRIPCSRGQQTINISVVSSDISLSRFDLVFIMRDVKDKDSDGQVAHHVLKMHQHRDPKEQDGEVGH